MILRHRHSLSELGMSRFTLFSAAAIVTIFSAGISFAQTDSELEDEKAFYSIGAGLSNQLLKLRPISDREFEQIFKGMRDAVEGKPTDAIDAKDSHARIRKLLQARKEAGEAIEKAESVDFLVKEAQKLGAKKTESGLIITEMTAGRGASPSATDKVKVHYHGMLRDETVFDSSVDRGRPSEFPLNRVIPCWTEGVAMMREGGKSRLVCPADIAYGNKRKGRIPPESVLIFEVELIEIVN